MQGIWVLVGKGLLQCELNPILDPREAPEGFRDDNPHQKPGRAAFPWGHGDGQIWQGLDGWCCQFLPDPVPVGPLLGRFIPLLASLPKVFPCSQHSSSLEFGCQSGISRGTPPAKPAWGAKFIPNPCFSVSFVCWILLIIHRSEPPGAGDAPGTGCLLLPSSLRPQLGGGPRGVRSRGKWEPPGWLCPRRFLNLFIKQRRQEKKYPTSRRVSRPPLPPKAQPRLGLGRFVWILQKTPNLVKTEQKKHMKSGDKGS